MRRLTHGTDRCGRGALPVTAVAILTTLLAIPATAGAATAGGLRQLGAGQGCIVDEASPPAGCIDVRGMTNIGRIAVSPDGKTVYVPSRGRSAIAVFARNASTGALTQRPGVLGCYTSNSTVATQDGCTLVTTGLNGVGAVAVSPDGGHVYAGGTAGAMAHFTRTASGDLAYVGAPAARPGTIRGITVSPDNASVYTSHTLAPGGFIAVYQVGSGHPSGLVFRQCWKSPSASSTCTNVSQDGYVDDPGELLVTPDGKQLLVGNGENLTTSYGSGSVVGFGRTTSGANRGNLAGPTSATCISGALANCQTRASQNWIRGLSSADNGTRIYAAGRYGVFRFNRNPSTNGLTPVGDTSGCVSYEGNPYTCASSGTTQAQVVPHRAVVVPPDGANVYSANVNGTSTTLYAMNRAASGSFSVLAPPFRCLSVPGGPAPCATALTGGATLTSMVASPQGPSLYAAGGNRLFSFARDRPPVCQNVSASTGHNTAVAVTLNCSDPDGDAVTYQKVTDPVRGAVGAIQGNQVSYGPLLGTSGVDSFQYRAVSNGPHASSDPATVAVTVAGAPPPPPPPPPPSAKLTAIPSTTAINSLAFTSFTKLVNLSVRNLVAGSTVRVTCKTKKRSQQKKGCPYKSKRFSTSGARSKLNLRKPYGKRRLPVGTRITITISAPGFITKQIRYSVRRRKIPKSSVRCIPAGGKAGSCA